MKQKLLCFFAFVALIPALVAIANFTVFALFGDGFLMEGTTDMNFARTLITAMSLLMSWVLLMVSSLE